jgi:hypothetical protein
MSLPKPINWVSQQQGSSEWLLYQHICQFIKTFDALEISEEFISLFHKSVIDFEERYPAVANSNTVSNLKFKVYQQIISQLPLEIGGHNYQFEDFADCSIIPNEMSMDNSISDLITEDKFPIHIWNALSLGLKICNYQDKGIAAMRDTMTIEWIQAQAQTPMFHHKASLIKLTSNLPGKHGFDGLGSLFG